ncbi:MAG TPA: GIY-YIG nuclease family protein [Allosphingosinicella sp.]|nr:GIY-YIG nuclease family protein [Allosphingosinicella sp.]
MGFWTYMLHCADRSFYVGHTDDLDARIGAHQSGLIPGYTSTRLPVTLVWADEFPSRYEALQAERQIKGWGRAKKLALIRGDWELIAALARNTEEKERASTSSARTGEGAAEVNPTHRSP